MKLTALEIKQQTFDKSLRGYDPAEVQAFLNLVSNEWEHLVTKNKELTAQIESLNNKLKHYERVESALHETLQTARESAEQKLGGAKQESKNILEKAELEAESIIREAYQERQQVRQSVVRLLDRRKEIIAAIRSYLERAQDALDGFSQDDADLFSLPSSEKKRTETTTALSEQTDQTPEEYTEKADIDKKAAKQTDNNSSKKKEDPAGSGTGDDDMDDILDQID